MDRTVSLRHYRCFLTVANTKSFTAAASRMFITQSSLTATIQQFEEAAGVKLFERTTRRVVLTEAGARFKDVAQRLVGEFDTSLRDLRAFGDQQQNHVRLAAAISVMYGFVSPAIPRIRAACPHIRLSLFDSDAMSAERLLIDGDIDFAIVSKHSGYKELQYIPLLEDRFGVVCCKPYPLASARTALDWKDLPVDDYVPFAATTGVGSVLAAQRAAARLYTVPHDEVSSSTSLYAVLGHGDRYSIAPALVTCAGPFPNLHFRPLQDPVLTREVSLITRRLRYMTPDARRILDILLESFGANPLPRGVKLLKRSA